VNPLSSLNILYVEDNDDLRDTIDRKANFFNPPDPRFDTKFVPQAPQYAKVGYRPVSRQSPAAKAL